jgi:uncharacterized protein (TIRG00374 family)
LTLNIKKIAQYLISFGLMGFFLYWAFADQDAGELWQAISGISYSWVVVITLITLCTLFIRAWRWTVLMRPFAPQVGTIDASLALAICYAANVAIPRSGEFLRAISLKWTRQAQLSPVLATVVVERILDLFWLIVYIGLALLIQREQINAAFPILEVASIAVMALCLIALVFLALISIYRERALDKIRPILEKVSPNLAERVLHLLRTFIQGLEALQSPAAYAQIILSSLLLNTGYVLIIYATFCGMGLDESYGLGMPAALVIMAISSLGVIVPIPGGAGSYHIAFSVSLQELYHLPETQALACATLAHALATLTYLAIGAPALLVQWLQNRKRESSDTSLPEG